MKLSMKKIAVALGSLAVLTAATSASAFPTFSIQPGAIKPGAAIVGGVTNLDTIKGGASERLLANPVAQTFSGNGLLTLDGFFQGAHQAYVPNLQGGFQMYVLFSLTDVLTSGTFGAPGSTYAITSLNFKIMADVNNNDDFVDFGTATAGHDPTAGSAAQQTDDVMIGFGSLVVGTAAINAGGGSNGGAVNSTETLSLCTGTTGQAVTGGVATTDPTAAGCGTTSGTAFFFQPSPFYNLAFDEFNNTGSNFNPVTGELLLTGGSGSINFAIPEPGSIALIGIAAVAAGLSTRRRRKAA
jgi:hypothetical protein